MTTDRLPTITIVTPSFNQATYLEKTVRSVLLQRYPKLEYIVLDGGSTDASPEIIERYRPHFRYARSAPDGGQSAAIAEGLNIATGEILAFLNSDDLLAPGTLWKVMQFFAENPQVDALYSHRVIIDEDDIVRGHWILPPHCSYLMRRWDLIPQETCFWRRRLFEQGGNADPTLGFAFDYDLFVRYLNCGKFKRLPQFLAAFRIHTRSKTSTMLETLGRAEIEIVQRRYNIHIRRYEECVGLAFSALVMYGGRLSSAGFLPTWNGPAVGSSFDRLWGGMLSQTEVPQAVPWWTCEA